MYKQAKPGFTNYKPLGFSNGLLVKRGKEKSYNNHPVFDNTNKDR